jgi:tRNA(fMet)-specific endonuclease VapC
MFLNGRSEALANRLAGEIGSGSRIALPAIVWFELRYGAAKSAARERNLQRLADFMSARIDILPFTEPDAADAGDIRAHLERIGQPIGPYDILIAAQARTREAVLITANGDEFRRVEGLRIDDWSA